MVVPFGVTSIFSYCTEVDIIIITPAILHLVSSGKVEELLTDLNNESIGKDDEEDTN